MSNKERFRSKVISAGRVTIPEAIRDVLNLEDGDIIEVSVGKHMKLNKASGFYEEVGSGDSGAPSGMASHALDSESASDSHEVEGLDDMFGELDPKRRKV